jgi:hypothetical protein
MLKSFRWNDSLWARREEAASPGDLSNAADQAKPLDVLRRCPCPGVANAASLSAEGNLTAVSDYRYRGVSLSARRPALQADLTLSPPAARRNLAHLANALVAAVTWNADEPIVRPTWDRMGSTTAPIARTAAEL